MKFNVPDMSCNHCTSAIEKAIRALDATAKVECHLSERRVAVDSVLNESAVSAAILDAGYVSSVVSPA